MTSLKTATTVNKGDLLIRIGTHQEVAPLLAQYHYLTGISKGFKSGSNYTLWDGDTIIGVCIFTGFPVPELVKGMFGLERSEQDGMFELSRLVLEPNAQRSYHNLASWFVSRCIKDLRKRKKVRVILSYADSDHHAGVVYKALNFTYYGLTDKKSDFYVKNEGGHYTKQSRGKTKGVDGEWRPRSRKHRYVMIFCKELQKRMLWEYSQ